MTWGTALLRTFGFALKLHGPQLFATAAVLSILAAWLTRLAMALGATAAQCALAPAQIVPPDCTGLQLLGTIGDDEVRATMAVVGLAPFALGSILGVPIVARELELGTLSLAWSVAISRSRWLLATAVPVLACGVFGMLAVGVLADWVEASHVPGVAAAASMADFGSRGPILASRFALAYCVALLTGLLVRRALPGLLLALVINAAIMAGLAAAIGLWTTATPMPPIASPLDLLGNRLLDPYFLLPDGRHLTVAEAEAIDPTLSDPAIGTSVTPAIKGGQYPVVAMREAAACVALSVVLVAVSVRGLARTRPV